MTKFDHEDEQTRSTKDHILYQLRWARVPDAVSSFIEIDLAKKTLKCLSKDGHGGHLDHVTWIIYIRFHSPLSRRDALLK